VEAGIGPFGGKVGEKLFKCGEVKGDTGCKFGPLYCSGKFKMKDTNFRGAKLGGQACSQFLHDHELLGENMAKRGRTEMPRIARGIHDGLIYHVVDRGNKEKGIT
jgi:hypothetical protein